MPDETEIQAALAQADAVLRLKPTYSSSDTLRNSEAILLALLARNPPSGACDAL